MSLKVAVIGAGHLGQYHAAKYAASPGVQLLAVADIDAQRATSIAGPLGARACTDFRDLLDDVDAVSIAVPAAGHFAIAQACLLAGLHVLIEKPLAVNLREADTLVALARRRQRVLQVGHVERFNPVMCELLRRIDRPQFIECHRLAPYKARGTDVDVILDLMIHDLDLIAELVAAPVTSIDASGVAVVSSSPDIANARLHFANGCVANVTSSRVSLKVERKLRVFQRDAYYSADLQKQELTECHKGDGGEITHAHRAIAGDALQAEIESFIEAVRGGRRAPVSGEDGRRALQLSLEIAAQIRTPNRVAAGVRHAAR
jgi:predicted dehydrogenase